MDPLNNAIANNFTQDTGYNDFSHELGGGTSERFLESYSADLFEFARPEFRDVCRLDQFTELFYNKSLLHTVHDACGLSNGLEVFDWFMRYQQNQRNRRFLLISKHVEEAENRTHYHVIHSCAWSNRSCRCRMFDGCVRTHYRRVPGQLVTKQYARNLLCYLSTFPRSIKYLYLPREGGEVLLPIEGISFCGCSNCTVREVMDEGDSGFEICDPIDQRQSNRRTNNVAYSSNSSTFSESSRRPNHGQEEALYQLVKSLAITPINNSILSIHWLNSEFKFYSRSNQVLQTVFSTWSRELKHKSFKDFIEMYTEHKPFFSCTSANITDYYYTIEESIARVQFLLGIQFPDIDVRINFLQNLYLTLAKENGKKNTILIVGPPSSGKTYFIRFVSNFFISVGQIRNFNRNDNFPLNDCPDKRVLLWDEPNFTRENLDTIKMLFAGDNCPANVKYENQVVIDKTPILVTSNTDIFPENEIFNVRLSKYYWSVLPSSTEDFKQLYPLALIDIFKLYNIL